MSGQPSCLVQNLSHYIDLTDHDRELLATLERSPRDYSEATEIHSGGDRNRDLYVVKQGWLFSYTDLPDGRRQIVKIHHPGDVIGFPDIAMKHMTTNLRSVEPVTLCPFPKSALETIFTSSPRLSALMLSIALRDQVVFIDLLRVMGRMSAMERVSHFVLDLLARLRITNKDMTDTFRLPLNQSQIADYLGLTNVYISKTFKRLQDDGMLSRDGQQITLTREEELKELVDFEDRYIEMDTSWFPGG
ncbi:Crp/Fnr family transcriptional regulator [Paracoccus sp. TK19116]|uniref:Crp/Fnr family transcriptional regulator n=1 Tax=Paracoccus albicereus TaxID=2922394 RepID=A0ABT1MMT6_9RHOB|nr:Crp/Fnr family transcriptional regulator [Paracoccus albicereus]MCQ0969593.1 Crp/Fnr family transcriptional regulator [Paracoccus albicereus]